jgi:serine/threonine protein kinase
MNSERSFDHGIQKSLAAYFPSDCQLLPSPDRSFSDADINAVSTLLLHIAEPWSKVPRTYIVLRTIGRVDLMNDLIDAGFTDHWFPVTTNSLPSKLSPTVRTAFEQAQVAVLTKSIDLEKGQNGKHQHFARGESVPFQPKEILGRGGFSEVDKVISTISGREYARKRVRRRVFFEHSNTKEQMKLFVTEIKILKRLKHQHIVEFVGSYTDASNLGLIMYPVADMDLASYLNQSPARKPTIRTFFGCLATALQFLHDNGIRHKDVKPQNVLVHGKNILFTDFGLSRDADGMGSTTSGFTLRTLKYCAPEVFAWTTRDSSSDVWSLGCIYLEMVAVLKDWQLDKFHAYFKENGTKDPYFHSNPSAVAELITTFRVSGSLSDNDPLDWAEMMLRQDRHARPTAAALTSVAIEGNSKYGAEIPFCGLCCRAVDDFEDMDYPDDEFDDLTEATEKALQIQGEDANSTTATRISEQDKAEAISWLTERGMDPRSAWKQRDKNVALFEAAMVGRLGVVRYCIAEGASIDEPHPWLSEKRRKDPRSDVDSARYIVPSKDNLSGISKSDHSQRSQDEVTALLAAVFNGHIQIVQLLLSEGAQVNFRAESSKCTVISYAALKGQAQAMRLLLDEGANPEAFDYHKRTPLHLAAEAGQEDAVKLLVIDAGVNPDPVSNGVGTALSQAAKCGHLGVVELLLSREGVNVNRLTSNRPTALAEAAGMGQVPVVKLLLGRDDVDINLADKFGRMPLSLAAGSGHEEVVRLLLMRKDLLLIRKDLVRAPNRFRQTPLDLAKRNGHEGVVKLLENAFDAL